jgi:cyclophilin family peptidyl-prolyl cis-trans isomerase
MSQLLRVIPVSLLGLLAALPAQEGAKSKPQEPAKAESKAPAKDDEATAKDPAIQAIDKFIAEKKVDKKGSWKSSLAQPPKVPFDPASDYLWHIETEVGALSIRYHADTAPVHVTSGIYLARLGFYDGLGFHRIIPGFMAQGGCPEGSGRGGPGYKFAGEFDGAKKHTKAGILSMANAGPNTDGSQFFITFRETGFLDGKHTVWGEVVSGEATLKALEGKGTQANNGMLATPVKIVRTWVTVAPKGKKDEAPKAEPAKGAEKAGDKK